MSPTEPDLSLVHRPMSRTNGLANAHCINPQLYAEESQALLCKQWAGPAMATSIPNPGDAIPLTFFGIPLLLLRDQKGHVRVFQNTCRHRDMILLQEPRTITGLIRCPITVGVIRRATSWSAPHMSAGRGKIPIQILIAQPSD
jgi:choline monooxygenase